MNDLTITITGWAATTPTVRLSAQGIEMSSFRLASTPRYFDRNAGVWTDGRTEWFTVRCFRSSAVTVAQSVKKGEPVIVTGKLRTHEWTTNDGLDRVDLQIDATGVGHDLTRGISAFSKATVATASDEPGEPADDEAAAGTGSSDELEPEDLDEDLDGSDGDGDPEFAGTASAAGTAA